MRVPWNRSGLRSYVILVALLANEITPVSILQGIPFVALGMAMHVWAKGCLKQNEEVTRSGPYRFVRHPFYVANGFLDAGLAIMSGWWVLQLALPIWWLAVYLPAMRREERAMTERFGPAYEAFQRDVPQFFPYRLPAPAPPERFSWLNPNLLHTELPRALRYVCYPLVFFLVHRLWLEGAQFFTTPSPPEIAAAISCVALYGASIVIRRRRKGFALPVASAQEVSVARATDVTDRRDQV